MKAILVTDMPENCRECPCGDFNICSALVKTHTNKMLEQREDWCPLKPMPEKIEMTNYEDLGSIMYRNGWNKCIYTILGEEDD